MTIRPFALGRLRPGAAVLAAAFTLACSVQPSPSAVASSPSAEAPEEPSSAALPPREPTTRVADSAPAPEPANPADPAAKAAWDLEDPWAEDPTIYTDENGAAYSLLRVPKAEGQYVRLEDGKIRARWGFGFTFEVAREEPDAFWVKIYQRTEPIPAPEPPPVPEAVEESAVQRSQRLRFDEFGRGLPERGQWRNGSSVADINADGRLDIVHGPVRKGPAVPQVFLGDGAGSWEPWRGLRFPSMRLDYGDVAVADFNGDGRMDVALAMHLRGLAVLVQTADGEFASWGEGLDYNPEQSGLPAFSSRTLIAVDWNRDGRPDLLALGEGPRLLANRADARPGFEPGSRGPVLYLNRGDGSWERRDQGVGGEQPFGDNLATGDFNADGRLDFVTASSAVGVLGILFVGQPDGTWKQEPFDLLPAGSLVWGVAAADFDGDRRDDLALGVLKPVRGGWRTQVEFYRNRRTEGWERTLLGSKEGREGVRSLAVGDLDADGRLDLVAGTGAGELWVFLGDGKGGFTREDTDGLEPPGLRCGAFSVTLANLDGRPGDELVVGYAGEGGSEVLIPGTEARCPTGGALRAWKAAAQ